MNKSITIHQNKILSGRVSKLPASKSISNRVIILNALSGDTSLLTNLSEANDTRLMQKLIHSENGILNVEDAGTTMRFLAAYFAVTDIRKVLTGTDRMKLRPLGVLVEALQKLGSRIAYLENEGFPPIQTQGFNGQSTNELTVRGDISSQFISAIMMVAPILPDGLLLKLEGKVTSRPYIEMTASLMKHFGVSCEVQESFIQIHHQAYTPAPLVVEYDWSAASYWFAFVALSDGGQVELPNMTIRSIQGDRVIVDIMEILGVKSEPRGNSLHLAQKDHRNEISWDFSQCPDLAQTVAVVCAAKGIEGKFTGLESLRIKEADRIQALQKELSKLGAHFTEENGKWLLKPSREKSFANLSINTYLDHRMAMAFAPLAVLSDITIENPDVVRKSYPKFWEDMGSFGFKSVMN